MELKQITREEYMEQPSCYPMKVLKESYQYSMMVFEKEELIVFEFCVTPNGELCYSLSFTKEEKQLVVDIYEKNYNHLHFLEAIRKHILLEKLQEI